MKALAKILAGGFAVFMVLAIADEWSFFSTAWFGKPASAGPAVDEQQQQAAVGSLRSYLALVSHLYASDGDRRFAERIPASPGVVGEMMADIVYLRHNGRYQELVLHGLEVLDVAPLAADRVEVRTKEYWTIRTLFLADDTLADPPRGQIAFARYGLEREAAGWRVVAWELDVPPAPPEPPEGGDG